MSSLTPISHSMADAYASCQKRFEYSHIKKLMPMETPEALARGTWGHKTLEIFFTAIKEGDTHEHAKQIACLNAMDTPKYFGTMWKRIEHFVDNIYPTLGWEEILDIEATRRVNLPATGYSFPFTIDLVVRLSDGSTKAIDFKFGADAYSDEMVKLYPQLPKYVGGLMVLASNNELHYPVPTSAMYVFIRSRSNIADPTKFVDTAELRITTERIKNSFIEQDKTSSAILAHIASGRPYLHSYNNNCKFCPFIQLCVAEINGQHDEAAVMEQVLYQENSYGYEVEETV